MRLPVLFLVAALSLPTLSLANPRLKSNMQALPSAPKVETIFRPGEGILVVGDSLVAGYGVRKEQTFHALLDEWTPAYVRAEGKSGETSDQLLKRLPNLLKDRDFKWVIIVIGGNDRLRVRGDAELRKNVIEMVKMVKAVPAHPVLVAIPDPRTRIDMPLYREIGGMYRAPVLENLGRMLEDRHFLKDGVHPNAEGYQVIAREMVNFFAKDPPKAAQLPQAAASTAPETSSVPVSGEPEVADAQSADFAAQEASSQEPALP